MIFGKIIPAVVPNSPLGFSTGQLYESSILKTILLGSVSLLLLQEEVGWSAGVWLNSGIVDLVIICAAVTIQ